MSCNGFFFWVPEFALENGETPALAQGSRGDIFQNVFLFLHV